MAASLCIDYSARKQLAGSSQLTEAQHFTSLPDKQQRAHTE